MDTLNCSCAFLNVNLENALFSIALAMYEKTLKRVFSYMSPWFDFFTASRGSPLRRNWLWFTSQSIVTYSLPILAAMTDVGTRK